MKPRTGDGPLEVTKEGRGIVMRVPARGWWPPGGRAERRRGGGARRRAARPSSADLLITVPTSGQGRFRRPAASGLSARVRPQRAHPQRHARHRRRWRTPCFRATGARSSMPTPTSSPRRAASTCSAHWSSVAPRGPSARSRCVPLTLGRPAGAGVLRRRRRAATRRPAPGRRHAGPRREGPRQRGHVDPGRRARRLAGAVRGRHDARLVRSSTGAPTGPKQRPVARVVLTGFDDADDRAPELVRAVAVGGAGWRARMLATVPSNLKNAGLARRAGLAARGPRGPRRRRLGRARARQARASAASSPSAGRRRPRRG